MDDDGGDSLFFLSIGPLLAIFLGMALVPLRGFTTASNFTFVFLALTIVVAEFGGRWAAVATALCSALSLDFFLTQPYLRLSIEDKHDIIAFVGLGVCGLIAAALGSQRGERIAGLSLARKHLELLQSGLGELGAAGPVEPRLTRILQACGRALPIAAVVVRDERGYFVAASDRADEMRPAPDQVLPPDSLLPGESSGPGLVLSEKGSRIALATGARPIGWLDVWGDGRPLRAQSRRALSDVAGLVAALLAGRSSGPGPRAQVD